jgi:hypothetical protein
MFEKQISFGAEAAKVAAATDAAQAAMLASTATERLITIPMPGDGTIRITPKQGLIATGAGAAAFFGAKALGMSLFYSFAASTLVPVAIVYWLGKK